MNNYNLNVDIKELLDFCHKSCQIKLNPSEYDFMFEQIKLFMEQLPALNQFNNKIYNVEPYKKFWQTTKLREDIPEYFDTQAIFQNNSQIKNNYFVIEGNLYGGNNEC